MLYKNWHYSSKTFLHMYAHKGKLLQLLNFTGLYIGASLKTSILFFCK